MTDNTPDKLPVLAAKDFYQTVCEKHRSRRTTKVGVQTISELSITDRGRRFFYIETGWDLDEWIAAFQQHIKETKE